MKHWRAICLAGMLGAALLVWRGTDQTVIYSPEACYVRPDGALLYETTIV